MDSSTRFRDFLLGLVFFGTILALLYYTVVLTGFSFGQRTYYDAWFPNANGLKQGDAILVSGHQAGKVKAVHFEDGAEAERRIRVEMEFDEPVTLREGYRIMISEFTMLGGRVIEIDPGPFGARPLEPGQVLTGTSGPSALALLGDFLEENRQDVRAMVSNLRKASDDLAAGKGVLGALLSDPSMKEDLQKVFDQAQALAEDIRAGKGTLGMLIQDEVVRDRVVNLIGDGGAAMIDLRRIAEDLAAGRGTIGALLTDESLREDVSTSVVNLRDASDRIAAMLKDAQEGRGLVGKLLGDEKLAQDASDFMANLAAVSARLNQGEGTLGRLLADDDAYQQIVQALRTLNAQLEDAREAQPISTFASMLFGTTVGN